MKYYITDIESAKCKRVMEAFAELYENSEVLALDAGRYGFVVLQYFDGRCEFSNNKVYNNCRDLFENLWENWLDVQLLSFASGTPMVEMDYEDIFGCLPIERQEELMAKRNYFADKAGITLEE